MKKITNSTPVTEETLNRILDQKLTSALAGLKDFMFSTFATKEDLKEELSAYATKEDLKEELSAYATKEDLKEELSAYATKEDIEEAFDMFAKTDLAQATVSVIEAIENGQDRINPVLKNHEKRIKSLEHAKN